MTLVYHCYAIKGIIESFAGMVVYIASFYYYGFNPAALFGIVHEDAYPRPNLNDMYDPNDRYLGNSNLNKSSCVANEIDKVDWFSTKDANYDLRHVYVNCI